MELEDADLLEYDQEDSLSTIHEVGIEEDLELAEAVPNLTQYHLIILGISWYYFVSLFHVSIQIC